MPCFCALGLYSSDVASHFQLLQGVRVSGSLYSCVHSWGTLDISAVSAPLSKWLCHGEELSGFSYQDPPVCLFSHLYPTCTVRENFTCFPLLISRHSSSTLYLCLDALTSLLRLLGYKSPNTCWLFQLSVLPHPSPETLNPEYLLQGRGQGKWKIAVEK